MSTVAARTILRSTRIAAARLAGGVKPNTTPSPFRFSSQKPLSARIFRSPVEMSCVSVVSMLPYHSVTASAVLISMLSVAPRGQGWNIEDFLVPKARCIMKSPSFEIPAVRDRARKIEL